MLLAGIETFVISTEPDGVGSLLDSCERLKAPIDKLHWARCLPASSGWMELEDMVTKISSMDQKGLADIRDLGKSSFRPAAMRFLENLKNFADDKDGKRYGDVTQFDDTKCLAIDSLSGWSAIAWGCTVGYKPTANPGEWGIAQQFISNMLMKINNDRMCYFILTAHQEKEMDDMTGIKKIMVSTIGAKLAPKIPTFFSEVVQCTKEGNDFYWATTGQGIDLKNRALPVGVKLKPDFRPIVEAYERRKKQALAMPQANTGVEAPAKPVGPQAPLPIAPMTPAATRSN